MMWWHGNWNGWAWLAMSASMIVFWGLVIWAVLRVVSSTGGNTVGRPANEPEQILRERFARGEIDAEEFEHRRELLRR
jgi:putative membrane protein